MLTTLKLKNGLKLAAYQVPNLRSVHVTLFVKGGSLLENKDNTGIAHFMEHILVQGTPSFPTGEQLAVYVEGLSGTYVATTASLGIYFDIHLPADRLEDALKISSEVFFSPLFDPEAIEKEKRVVINEIGLRKDSVSFQLHQFFIRNRYIPNSPLALTTLGEPETITKLRREDLVEYWGRLFVPNNTYLVVVGNFSEKDLRSFTRKFFGSLKKRPFKKLSRLNSNHFSSLKMAVRNDPKLSQAYIDITFPGVGMHKKFVWGNKEYFYLAPLGRLRNSRLPRLLRYQMGLVYGIKTYREFYPGVGYVGISTEVDPVNLELSIKSILDELKKYIAQGPTDEEIAFSKRFITSWWQMSFDNPGNITPWIIEGLIRPDEQVLLPEYYIRLVKNWSRRQFQELVEKYWNLEKIQITVQGPSKKNQQLEDRIEKLITESKIRDL